MMWDSTVITYHVRPPEWIKWIKEPGADPVAWSPGFTLTTETSDTIVITDVVIAFPQFFLTEIWNPDHLKLTDYEVTPLGAGIVITATPGELRWRVEGMPAPETMTITKFFHVEPCTWTETIMEEYLDTYEQFEPRPIIINKLAPSLWIDSVYEPGVVPGQVATFTLNYSNTGGLENSVWITNTFPAVAPFRSSNPEPDDYDQDDGLWAAWYFPELSMNATGAITVTVTITDTAAVTDTYTIWDGIYDHVGELADEVTTTFQTRRLYIPIILRNWGYSNG
jgi:hypothetical protein